LIPKLGEYENKIEVASREVDKLNNIVEGKNREIKDYQVKLE
jgi:hypothetical protein